MTQIQTKLQPTLFSQDPPFMTSRGQLAKLDHCFEQFTTDNLKSNQFVEEGDHFKVEEIYIFLITQVPEFQTRQNRVAQRKFQEQLKLGLKFYGESSVYLPQDLVHSVKALYEANHLSIPNNFRRNMALKQVLEKQSVKNVFSQIPVFVIEKEILPEEEQLQGVVNLQQMVQQYSLEYKAQLLLINYYCNLRLDKFLKKLRNCIKNTSQPHHIKMEQTSDQLDKDVVPGSWDDDELQVPQKKKRSRTPGAQQSAQPHQVRPKTPTNKVVKRVQKQCFKDSIKGEGHALAELENNRDLERRNLLQKAEELRKKTELEKKSKKREEAAKNQKPKVDSMSQEDEQMLFKDVMKSISEEDQPKSRSKKQDSDMSYISGSGPEDEESEDKIE